MFLLILFRFGGMDDHVEFTLLAEDRVERRIGLFKEAISDTSKSLGDILEGKCRSCNRIYPKEYLNPINSRDYDKLLTDDPTGYCIPCWREVEDLPKMDREA